MTIHAPKYANFFSRDAFDVIREGVWVAQTDVNRPHTEIRLSLLKKIEHLHRTKLQMLCCSHEIYFLSKEREKEKAVLFGKVRGRTLVSGGTSLSCKLSIILSVQDEGFVERLLVEELDKLGTLRSKSNIHGESTNLLVKGNKGNKNI